MKRRVVVTGLGAVTPIGNTVEEFWKSKIAIQNLLYWSGMMDSEE